MIIVHLWTETGVYIIFIGKIVFRCKKLFVSLFNKILIWFHLNALEILSILFLIFSLYKLFIVYIFFRIHSVQKVE